jgi:hypothetical protein
MCAEGINERIWRIAQSPWWWGFDYIVTADNLLYSTPGTTLRKVVEIALGKSACQ